VKIDDIDIFYTCNRIVIQRPSCIDHNSTENLKSFIIVFIG